MVCIVLITGVGIYLGTEEVAVPEKRQELNLSATENKFYLSEDGFVEKMKQEVEPYNNSRMTEGTFENGSVSLYYRIYKADDAKRTVVINHGFTEYIDKYHEVIYYYLQSGYDVYMMEHRGHGASTREVEDKGIVYVESFDDYADDFKKFIDEIVVKNSDSKPMYLFAHSMGGAIATRFIQENPGYFKAAVLSAPMLDVNTGSVPESLANMLAKASKLIGKEADYVLGYGPYENVDDIDSSATASEARYRYYRSHESGNENYQGSGPSYSWLKAAIAETKRLTSEENVKKIDIPVLLLQAENDSLVEANGLYKLASRSDKVEFIIAKDSKHQIWSEENSTMIPYFNTVFSFLEKY